MNVTAANYNQQSFGAAKWNADSLAKPFVEGIMKNAKAAKAINAAPDGTQIFVHPAYTGVSLPKDTFVVKVQSPEGQSKQLTTFWSTSDLGDKSEMTSNARALAEALPKAKSTPAKFEAVA